jgi:dephospho-CoA kinase
MNFPKPICLGVTGGIACGKTEAGHCLSAQGLRVLDSDFLAHELMKKDRPVFRNVVKEFGRGILADDGGIDRSALGARVFNDPAARETLNRLVHPAVIDAGSKWIRDCRAAGADCAVLVPLLFEAGWTADWDAVLCITADEETVLQRLENRGLSRDEARRRMAAQLPQQEKAARSDFSIENNGMRDELEQRISCLLETIRQRRTKHEQ